MWKLENKYDGNILSMLQGYHGLKSNSDQNCDIEILELAFCVNGYKLFEGSNLIERWITHTLICTQPEFKLILSEWWRSYLLCPRHFRPLSQLEFKVMLSEWWRLYLLCPRRFRPLSHHTPTVCYPRKVIMPNLHHCCNNPISTGRIQHTSYKHCSSRYPWYIF